MVKYDMALYHRSYEQVLERLHGLGLVDVTTTAWEAGEGDRALIASIEQHRSAVARLKQVAAAPDYKAVEPFDTAAGTMGEYHRITADIEAAAGQAARLRKEADELRMWGEFDPAHIEQLTRRGIELRYFTAHDSEFAARSEQWAGNHIIEKIASQGGTTCFVAVASPGEELALPGAVEVRIPMASISGREAELQRMAMRTEYLEKELVRCASSLPLLEAELEALKEKLDFHRVRGSATCGPEGMLMVLEGWATRESSPQVDAFLDTEPDIVSIKSDPTPEDDAPVLLKNRKYASLFELIGGFYSLPRYGTMDLTPYFAPFYMIFFGFCLCDGGYGLLLLLTGLILKMRGAKGIMGQVAGLTVWLGAATMLFGFLTGGFFGVNIYEAVVPLQPFAKHRLGDMDLFVLALVFGVVQILFGMLLKVILVTRQSGFKYTLGTLGWMIALTSTLAAMVLPMAGVSGFDTSSTAYLVLVGAGAFMMLFFNSPGKNPLVNFGSGLWNTYNDVTGFIGDLLSYIRLFAIGLSGGILAQVFNELAFGLAPDLPVVKQLTILLIILFGHGINIFMSCLSAFVHPLRLTFVEFYKNAGFESTMRAFTPFRKMQTNSNN